MHKTFGRLSAARIPIWPIALLALVGGGIFIFAALAEEVMEGERIAFDRSILLFFRTAGDLSVPIGPEWVKEAAVEVTALGGYPVIMLISAGVAGFLAVSGRLANALYVVLAVIGGTLLSSGLKLLIDRARPELVEHLDTVHTASFPSGHALITTVTYLTLGCLGARYAPKLGEKIYVISAAAMIAFLVGMTRIYLGVHWPSDVLAGWALGVSWASFAWCGAALLDRSRTTEKLDRKLRAVKPGNAS